MSILYNHKDEISMKLYSFIFKNRLLHEYKIKENFTKRRGCCLFSSSCGVMALFVLNQICLMHPPRLETFMLYSLRSLALSFDSIITILSSCSVRDVMLISIVSSLSFSFWWHCKLCVSSMLATSRH